ncbi:unnamed protein product [Amoebophrya sp. A25]|nr:unnamed protein product [Amoebophrya sp. A25]|eukprot:GSA25T00022535001.1
MLPPLHVVRQTSEKISKEAAFGAKVQKPANWGPALGLMLTAWQPVRLAQALAPLLRSSPGRVPVRPLLPEAGPSAVPPAVAAAGVRKPLTQKPARPLPLARQ